MGNKRVFILNRTIDSSFGLGSNNDGIENTYSLLDGFTYNEITYPTISAFGLSQLTSQEYYERTISFLNYVGVDNSLIQSLIDESVFNSPDC